MAQVLLIDDDRGTLAGFGMILELAGHHVLTASSATEGLNVLRRQHVQLVVSDLRPPDMSGLDVLRTLHDDHAGIPCVLVTGFGTTRDAVTALRLGPIDFLEKPLSEEELLRTINRVLSTGRTQPALDAADDPTPAAESAAFTEKRGPRAHAAARWARALVPVIEAAVDPRTVTGWSRLIFSSPGALRNWCRMAGISPRRSLVFARLLRAVVLGHGGQHKPENLLDVVDRRTLVGLLRFAGLNPSTEFPRDIEVFLDRQQVVRDPDALRELRYALAERVKCKHDDVAHQDLTRHELTNGYHR